MTNPIYSIGPTRFEVLLSGATFLGLGKIWIAETLVRSGRLPIKVGSTSFDGKELRRLELLGVIESEALVRVRLRTFFSPAETKLMRDHSFDPIHDTGDWDASEPIADGELDLIFQPACDTFNGIAAEGFAYHYEYRGQSTELFYLIEKATWELDGDICGSTIVSQSACSDPVVVVTADTNWSTEGLLQGVPDMVNNVMTHNLPRWASHQAFDFQWKDQRVLLGVFERVDLVRTVLRHEAGAAELKVFDKYLFNQALNFSTVAKKILLTSQVDSETAMRNLWTWVLDEVHDRARAEFGLTQEPMLPRLAQNFWVDFNYDSYFEDLIPAAAAIGAKQVFIDNVNKSAFSEGGVGNMCCGHEYEPAPSLGGELKLKELVERSADLGIQVVSWTNNDQAYSSPLCQSAGKPEWFVKMEDTRLKYGGAYTNVFAILDFANEEARRIWVDSLKKIRETTGLNGYLFDSFYNLGFMPVSYEKGKPRTMWRQLLSAFKELQDADVHFLIESFGPFGQVQHGCPRSYSIDRCWVCYEIGVGNDYTTVPTGLTQYEDPRADGAETLHYILAHKTVPPLALHREGVRIDLWWTEGHKRALQDYHEVRELMKRRYLQADGKSVIWHNEAGDTAVVWSFENQQAELSGQVFDVTSGQEFPAVTSHSLQASHTYTVKGPCLPVQLKPSARLREMVLQGGSK